MSMNSFDQARELEHSRQTAAPTVCPACKSVDITTTARKPDQNSYWRCSACDEIWNAARRQTRRPGYGWR
jgi:formate dehydrogenase maturation protein FdhE